MQAGEFESFDDLFPIKEQNENEGHIHDIQNQEMNQTYQTYQNNYQNEEHEGFDNGAAQNSDWRSNIEMTLNDYQFNPLTNQNMFGMQNSNNYIDTFDMNNNHNHNHNHHEERFMFLNNNGNMQMDYDLKDLFELAYFITKLDNGVIFSKSYRETLTEILDEIFKDINSYWRSLVSINSSFKEHVNKLTFQWLIYHILYQILILRSWLGFDNDYLSANFSNNVYKFSKQDDILKHISKNINNMMNYIVIIPYSLNYDIKSKKHAESGYADRYNEAQFCNKELIYHYMIFICQIVEFRTLIKVNNMVLDNASYNDILKKINFILENIYIVRQAKTRRSEFNDWLSEYCQAMEKIRVNLLILYFLCYSKNSSVCIKYLEECVITIRTFIKYMMNSNIIPVGDETLKPTETFRLTYEDVLKPEKFLRDRKIEKPKTINDGFPFQENMELIPFCTEMIVNYVNIKFVRQKTRYASVAKMAMNELVNVFETVRKSIDDLYGKIEKEKNKPSQKNESNINKRSKSSSISKTFSNNQQMPSSPSSFSPANSDDNYKRKK